MVQSPIWSKKQDKKKAVGVQLGGNKKGYQQNLKGVNIGGLHKIGG